MAATYPKGVPLKERLLDSIEIITETGCWIWTRRLTHSGYGMLIIDVEGERYCQAHRVSYRTFVGPIAPGLLVCHICDVRCCINPSHLYAGTSKDNVRDRIKRGRKLDWRKICQMFNPHRKLSPQDVLNIRDSSLTYVKLAKQFNVHPQTIYNIKSGKKWKTLLAPVTPILSPIDAEEANALKTPTT